MGKGLKEVNIWFLVGCGIVILSVVVMVVVISINGIGNSNAKQLVCKSNNSNITLTYDNNSIIGYTLNGYSFDLLLEQNRFTQLGMDKYIEDFANTFNANTFGTCTIEK